MEVFSTVLTASRSLIVDLGVGWKKNRILFVIHGSSLGMFRVSHTSGESFGMAEMIMPYRCNCFVLGHKNAEIFSKNDVFFK